MTIKITAPNAEDTFKSWIATRGGVFCWHNANLSGGNDLFTPAKEEGGNTYPKPHWGVDDKPTLITDINEFTFIKLIEVKRFRVAIRRGSQGLTAKLTDASTRKLRSWLDKFGPNSAYRFDYSTQEVVIEIPQDEFDLMKKQAEQRVARKMQRKLNSL